MGLASRLPRLGALVLGLAVLGSSSLADAQSLKTGRNASTGRANYLDTDADGILRTNADGLVVFPSLLRTTAGGPAYSSATFTNYSAKGAVFYLDITAEVGTATLDVKIQVQDPISEDWVDLTDAAFAQKSATGESILTIYPGIKQAGNVGVSQVLPLTWKAVATVAGQNPTDSFTFSLGAHYVQ